LKLPLLPDSLATQTLHRGAVVLRDEPLTISTPAQQWASGLSYVLKQPVVDGAGALVKSLRFAFDISVVRGRIGVGWTTADSTGYLIERFTSRPDCRITLTLDEHARVGRLVFRNVHGAGAPSVFVVHGARVEGIPENERRYPVSVAARELRDEECPQDGGTFTVFDTEAAIAINTARMTWLQEACLPLDNTRVLDAGCGVGHFVPFYLNHGCSVLAVDGREDNISELRRRLPDVEAHVADVQEADLTKFGDFDVIHCFGLAYHLESPLAALRRFAAICQRFIILETMVCDSSRPVSVLADETKAASQAMDGIGSRPSPSFLALALNRVGFDYVYGAADPPRHPDFQFTWQDNLDTTRNGIPLRCVFVASRSRLDLASLVPLLES
jgi:SAM-dependent methyltransferase